MMQLSWMKMARGRFACAAGRPGVGRGVVRLSHAMGALIVNALKRRGPVAALATFFHLGRRDPHRSARFRLLSSAAFLATAVALPALCRNYSALREQPECAPAFLAWSDSVRDLAAYQKTEITSTVLPALLRFEDRNSMASSIETRLPFLDYRLVEFGVGLKASLKIRDGLVEIHPAQNGGAGAARIDSVAAEQDRFRGSCFRLTEGVLASNRDGCGNARCCGTLLI